MKELKIEGHSLRMDFRGDSLIAYCDCGGWREEMSSYTTGLPLHDISDLLADNHQAHLRKVQSTTESV